MVVPPGSAGGGNTSGVSFFVVSDDEAGQRIDNFLLARLKGVPKSRIYRLLRKGEVRVNKGRIKPEYRLVGGDSVRVPPIRREEAPAVPVPGAALRNLLGASILMETPDLLVVDKPAGLVVHPAAGNLDGTLVNALLHHCQGRLSGIGGVARPGIVHRIDKDTSGLLVVAKTDPAHEGLSRQFAAHTVERVYTALTGGIPTPNAGRIEGALARSVHDRKKMAIVSDGRGRRAVTHYRLIRSLGPDAAQVECRLETGRTHQVRVHMASIGHALLGDPVYGRAGRKTGVKSVLERLEFRRQALHAGVLGFLHPITGDAVRFESALPEDMLRLIQALCAPQGADF